MTDSLLDIKRGNVGDVVGALLSKSPMESSEAGQKMVREAARFGINVRDYLTLSINPEGDLNGYELALHALDLPFKNDFENGILLQAANSTFQTFPGTRAMFPEVIDDMLRWANRQDQFESALPMISNSRTVNGIEMVSTVVDDDSQDRDTFTISEGGRIPVRTIRTSETTVKFYKHGSALRTTYEFNRRASLDLLTPYANRIARELERSKATAAFNVLSNGDGVAAAAVVTDQSSLAAGAGATHAAGVLNWTIFIYWLIQRAKIGVPVDTIIGNWDTAFAWAKLWAVSGSDTVSDADNVDRVLGKMGINGLKVPLPNFALSSGAAAGQIMGITKGETLEELVEAGSNIQESERSILNQVVNYVKTENTGYRLVYADTREIYDYAAA